MDTRPPPPLGSAHIGGGGRPSIRRLRSSPDARYPPQARWAGRSHHPIASRSPSPCRRAALRGFGRWHARHRLPSERRSAATGTRSDDGYAASSPLGSAPHRWRGLAIHPPPPILSRREASTRSAMGWPIASSDRIRFAVPCRRVALRGSGDGTRAIRCHPEGVRPQGRDRVMDTRLYRLRAYMGCLKKIPMNSSRIAITRRAPSPPHATQSWRGDDGGGSGGG
jgi:hypothetical protein